MPWCPRDGSRKVRYHRTASASNCDWRSSVNHRGKLVFCTSILVKAPPLRERDGPPSPGSHHYPYLPRTKEFRVGTRFIASHGAGMGGTCGYTRPFEPP